MPLRPSNLPCAKCPGRSRELYDNEKNATECNTVQQIFMFRGVGGRTDMGDCVKSRECVYPLLGSAISAFACSTKSAM